MEDSLEDYLKLLKNTKNNDETPQIKKEVLITAQIKKECEQRAMKIVEFCIDGRLRSQILLKCLPYINQSYYQDIIEERAIMKLCGYPICGRKIPEMPKKQYFISTKLNKVYDITDRKNYCSNHCYKASVHVKKQIDNSPLWLRKFDELPQFSLLKKTDGGLPGEEVDQGVVKPVPEPSSSLFTSISKFAELSLGEVVDNEITQLSNESKKKVSTSQMATIREDIEEVDVEKVDESKQEQSPKIETKKSKKTKQKQNKIDYKSIEEQVVKSFKQWLSLDTLIFIYGEEKIKQIVNDEKFNNYFEQLQIELQIDQHKYVEICRKLNLRELIDRKFDNRLIANNVLKPLPDYQKLKEDNRHIDLKVKSFYNGIINVDQNLDDGKKFQQNINNGGEEETPILPLVDTKSQNALRRNIFLKPLNKAIDQLLTNLKVESSIIIPDIPPLVKTFKLTANNIVFKPIVWNFIAVSVLKILALKNGDIEEVLNRQSSKQYLDSMLNCLPSKTKFVDDILNLIRNVDEFAKFYITSEDF